MAPTNCKLITYSGHNVEPQGCARLRVRDKVLSFQIVKEGCCILGKDACETLNLVSRVNSVDTDMQQNAKVKSKTKQKSYENRQQ